MPHFRTGLSILALLVAPTALGCSSAKAEDTDLGDVPAGPQTFHVAREGDAVVAGGKTRFVIKVTAGTPPTSLTGWVGVESGEGSLKYKASFDSKDGDFDDDVTAPSPLPAGSKFWLDVDNNGVKTTGSIALK